MKSALINGKRRDLRNGIGVKNPEQKSEVEFSAMYRFADHHDKVLMVLGVLCAICNGAAVVAVVFILLDTVEAVQGAAIMHIFLDAIDGYLRNNSLTHGDVLQDPSRLKSPCVNGAFNYTQGLCFLVDLSGDTLSDKTQKHVILFAILGCLVFLFVTCQVVFLGVSSQNQAIRMRRECLANILQQEIGWFDMTNTVELTSRLSSNISTIQSSIGEKFGLTVQATATFIVGYMAGLITIWKYSLVLLSLTPLLVVIGVLFTYVGDSMTTKQQKANSRASFTANEVFRSIRTVIAFGGEDKETKRYRRLLDEIETLGVKKYFWHGIMFGSLALVNFGSYILGLWYGGRLTRHDDNTPKDVSAVFFSITLGTLSLAVMALGFESIRDGREAARQVFEMIDRKSRIPSTSTKGMKMDRIKGDIQFRDVHFSQSSQSKVLSGVNVEFQAGQTVALVELSGHGSSTLMKMLLRFYDPDYGEILIDGHDIRDVNVKSLRQSIGFASQESVLFDTTISDNISYGREGVTEEEIFQATKEANAYDFIANLPERMYTSIGKGGVELKRGQKMRIAIARALIRNPTILLLDNITTALDEEDVSFVQNSVDKARQGRTTLIITDRPSTIKTADLIVVLEEGRVKEKGNFEQLMASEAYFYNYFMNQIQLFGEKDEFAGSIDDIRDTLKKTQLLPSESDPCDRSFLTTKSEKPDEELPQVSTLQILRLNSPEKKYLFLGFTASAIMGSAQIAFAYIFSEVLEVFSKKGQDQKDDIRKYCLYLMALGLIVMAATILQSWALSVAGEALTRRLRQMSFAAMLQQEMAWFDTQSNSVTALVERLEKDASLVKEGSTTRLASLIQCISALIVLMVVVTTFNFLLAIVTVGILSLSLVIAVLYMRLMKKVEVEKMHKLQGANKIAREALEKIKTVAPMTEEDTFYTMHSQKLSELLENKYWDYCTVGMIFAFTHALTHFGLAIVLWLECHLVDHDDFDPKGIYNVLAMAVFGALFICQIVVVAAGDEKSQSAARRIFHLLERQTKIDAGSSTGMRPAKNFFKGPIAVQQASFCNPDRHDVPVLQNMNFTVEPGQTVALVGRNGCDNSAIASLLERFYDLDRGKVSINNYHIGDINIKWLRAQIGLVPQEPVLFDCSIADNIAYGDNTRVVSMNEIISAARQANIHNFIQGLPNGYDTTVGERGTQLSDGQKQRLVIARAMIRDPSILLMQGPFVTEDEREQEAMSTVQQGRTSIIIARTLSAPAVQDANKILVVHGGRVLEQGTHDQLLSENGFYARLLKMQNLS